MDDAIKRNKKRLASISVHVKDIGGLGLTILPVLIGVCAGKKDCYRMGVYLILITLIMLALNGLSWMYEVNHTKAIRYRLLHNGVNILVYTIAIYIVRFAGLLCPEYEEIHGVGIATGLRLSKCHSCSNAVLIFSLFMIGVYVISSIYTIIRSSRSHGSRKDMPDDTNTSSPDNA